MANYDRIKEAPEQWTIRKLSSEIPGIEKQEEVQEIVAFIRKMFGNPPKTGRSEKLQIIMKNCHKKVRGLPCKKVVIMMDYMPEQSELEKKLDLVVSTIQKDQQSTGPRRFFPKTAKVEMIVGFRLNFLVSTSDDILYKCSKNICRILIRKKAEPSEIIDKKPVLKIKDDFHVRVLFQEVLYLSCVAKANRHTSAVHSGSRNLQRFPKKPFALASVSKAIKGWLEVHRWLTAGDANDDKEKNPNKSETPSFAPLHFVKK